MQPSDLKPPCAAARRRGILVADDDYEDFILLGDALKECCPDADVQWVQNGRALMDHLGSHAAPALIVLDLNMPLMGGDEALKALQENEVWRRIPVVMFVSKSYPRRDSLTGARAYMEKPATVEALSEFARVLRSYWLEKETAAEGPRA